MSATLVFGQGGANPVTGAELLRYGVGADDNGAPINIRAKSGWVPRHAGGDDFVFHGLFVTVTYGMDVTLRFKGLVMQDEESEVIGAVTVELRPVDITLVAVPGEEVTASFEVPFQVVTKVGGVEKVRNACRGQRIRVQVETVGGLGAGRLIFDGIELDLENMRESLEQN